MNRKVNQSGDQHTPGRIILGSNPKTGYRWEVSTPQMYYSFFTQPYPRQKGSDCMADLKKRNKLVAAEEKRLSKLFEDIDEDKKKVVSGLITQAARLKILLDEMWVDISEKGDYELFSQSENQIPYERERPVAKQYNSRDQSYQRVIKQLTDYLPAEKQKPAQNAALDGSDLL